MTLEEYTAAIMGLIEKPEAAPVNVKPILEELKKDTGSIESLTAKAAEQDKKIRDLQDTNVALLRYQLGQRPREEDADDGHIRTREDIDKFLTKLTEQAKAKEKEAK